MPVNSDKVKIQELALYLGYDALFDPIHAVISEEEVLAFLDLINSKRYLVQRTVVPKTLSWSEMALFNHDYDNARFRCQFRMNRESFFKLCGIISDHNAFNVTQDPVLLQLAVALFRLGSFGNGVSVQNVATKFGISEGSVVKFTERVITAIISFSGSWIRWPDRQERGRISTDMALNGLPKCIGFVDGTDIILDEAPNQNKEVYWSRKKKYCLQAQIICNPRKLIRDLFIGYPGSVHDAKVFAASPIGAHPERFFSPVEFIIGDSAYPLTDNVIVPFRKALTGLPQDKRAFNHHLSEYRVRVENTIGLLKGRFQSLKGLRIRISDDNKAHKRVCDWTHACVVLHNMLTEHDPWEAENEGVAAPEDDTHGDDLEIEANTSTHKRGQLRRLALFSIHKAI